MKLTDYTAAAGALAPEKFIPFKMIDAWRAIWRPTMKVAVVDGCFDLLHPGHIHCLTLARKMADNLIVGIYQDETAERMKGRSMLNNVVARAFTVGALQVVDAVTIIPSAGSNVKLCRHEFIRRTQPDHYVKGNDEPLPDDLLRELEKCGGDIHFAPRLSEYSTAKILLKI